MKPQGPRPSLIFVDPPTLASKLEKGHTASNNQWMALCPCHGDTKPSLSIRWGRNGETLAHCFAGYTQKELLDHFRSLGFTLKPLPPPRPKKPKRPIEVAASMALRVCTPSERMMFWLIREGQSPTYNGFEAAGVRRTAVPGGLRALEALSLILVARAAYRADRQRYDRNQYRTSDQWPQWEPLTRSNAAKKEALDRAKAVAAAARKTKGGEGKLVTESTDLQLRGVTLRGDVLAPLRGDVSGVTLRGVKTSAASYEKVEGRR